MLIIKIKVKKLCIDVRTITRPPHSAHASRQDILNIYTQPWTNAHYHCITYSVTTHPDDGQARPKHVGATD